MTPSPDPRHRLSSDELIAVVVAFLGIGSILLWGLTRNESEFNFGSLLGTPTSQAPNVTASPNPSGAAIVPVPPQASTGIGVPNSQLGVPSPEAAPQAIAPVLPLVPVPQPTTQAIVPTAPNSTLPNVSPAPNAPPAAPRAIVFSDVPANFWANDYITELSRRNILDGFADGTFRPNAPITRAEFATMVAKAFDKPKTRQNSQFSDLPDNYWAKNAIDQSVQTGFLNGYPNGAFEPNQPIPLLQMQTALANGLNLQPPASPSQTLSKFEDANELPQWAQSKVAAAVDNGLVTGYPSPQKLTPNRTATRADAAALIYQALVKEGRITPPQNKG